MMADVVVRNRYPLYNAGLKALIADAEAKHPGELDIEQRVIEAIWADPYYRLICLNADGSHVDLQDPDPAPWDDLTPDRCAALRLYIDEARNYGESLEKLTDAELAKRYDEIVSAKQVAAAAERREQGLQADLLAPFSKPAATADYAHWTIIVPAWTAEEATALSFGKDPRHVNVKTLNAYNPAAPSPFRHNFMERLALVERWIVAEKLGELFSPIRFLSWAVACKFEPPTELLQGIKTKHRKVDISSSDTKIHGNKLHRIYEIVLGFATSKYNLDVTLKPTDIQRGVYGNILKDFLSVGVNVSEETLRDLMRDAMDWAELAGHPILVRAKGKKANQNESQSSASKGKPKPG